MVRQVATMEEFDAVLAEAGSKAVIVDFTATWCGPCKAIAPVYEQLSKLFPEAVFIKVDVDQNQETAQKCGISAMPTFKVYKEKAEVDHMKGANQKGLEALVQKHGGAMKIPMMIVHHNGASPVMIDSTDIAADMVRNATVSRPPSDLKVKEPTCASNPLTENWGGFIASIIFITIFWANDGFAAKCDKPLPFLAWLMFVVVAALSVGGWIIGRMISKCCTTEIPAEALPQTVQRSADRVGEPYRQTNPVGRLLICLLCLANLFIPYWFIQGNIWLWETTPNATAVGEISSPNATAQGIITVVTGPTWEGLGCDPDLYWAIRGYFTCTFVVLGLCCAMIPCICCGIIMKQKMEAEKHDNAEAHAALEQAFGPAQGGPRPRPVRLHGSTFTAGSTAGGQV